MKKPMGLKLSPEIIEMLKEIATRQHRSIANTIETLIETEYKMIQKGDAIRQENKEYGCNEHKGNCDKCNLYYGCDRNPIKIEKENETKC